MVGHPTDSKYKHMVSNKLILNFPITIYDITGANCMLVPGLSGVRVKKVRNKSSRLNIEEYLKISEHFYKLNNFVMLADDVIFVNGYEFMVPSARNLSLLTIEHIPIQIYEQLSKILNKLINLYGRDSFIIRVILMDMKFEKVDEILGNFEVNIEVSREHMGKL